MRTPNSRDTRHAPASTWSIAVVPRAVGAWLIMASPFAIGCSSTSASPGLDASVGASDSGLTVIPFDAFAPDSDIIPEPNDFCALPGSVISTPLGKVMIAGADGGAPDASTTPDLSWLTVPVGFCAHYFGNAPHNRQLRFAPGGREGSHSVLSSQHQGKLAADGCCRGEDRTASVDRT